MGEPDEEEAFVLSLSETTAHIPRFQSFFRSEAWSLSTISFFEAYAHCFSDNYRHQSSPRRAAVHLAFMRLIEKLVIEHMNLGDDRVPFETFALFCALVGSPATHTSSVLHGYVDQDVVEQVATVLLAEDFDEFGQLMREYSTTMGGPADQYLVEDGHNAFGFAELFDFPERAVATVQDTFDLESTPNPGDIEERVLQGGPWNRDEVQQTLDPNTRNASPALTTQGSWPTANQGHCPIILEAAAGFQHQLQVRMDAGVSPERELVMVRKEERGDKLCNALAHARRRHRAWEEAASK